MMLQDVQHEDVFWPARATDQGNGWKMKHAKPAHSSSSACSPFVHVCHVTMHKIVLTVVMSDHFGLSVGLWGSLACLVGGERHAIIRTLATEVVMAGCVR